MKRKKESLMGLAKQNIGLGIMTGMGGSIMGAMPDTPGMGNIKGTTMAGLNMVSIGQMGYTGMQVAGMMGGKGKKRKTGNRVIDNII